MSKTMLSCFVCSLVLGSVAVAQPAPLPEAERAFLSDPVQITSRNRFVKAGESYFSHDAKWIVFQAIPVASTLDGEPDEHYSMYVAKVLAMPDGTITGIGEPILISRPGSANTCGWFHPKYPWFLLFGSTIEAPAKDEQPGYQRGSSRYVWQFPQEMEIVGRRISAIAWEYPEMKNRLAGDRNELPASFVRPMPIFTHDGYDAEGSWSSDGRLILYARMVDPATRNLDLYVYDTQTTKHIPIVEAQGYDGGPFFSPDDKWICYRSDRERNAQLQLFVAELAFDEDGAPTGIEREVQLTRNEHVNWAPYWHPSSRNGRGVIVYATSEMGHRNYEVFAIEVDPMSDDTPRQVRITHAAGFDGLPVFSPDGKHMMWTSQRGPMAEGEERPSSQIWIAKTVPDVFENADVLFAERSPETEP